MLPVRTDEPPGLARLCPGARRSFFCRMKCKQSTPIKEEHTDYGTATNNSNSTATVGQQPSSSGGTQTSASTIGLSAAPTSVSATVSSTTSSSSHGQQYHNISASANTKGSNNSGAGSSTTKTTVPTDRKYSVIHCTGYLKSWAPAEIGAEETDMDADGEFNNLSCLVAIGRIPTDIYEVLATDNRHQQQPQAAQHSAVRVPPVQFMSRHAIDGKFLFVDQRYDRMIIIMLLLLLVVFKIEKKNINHYQHACFRSVLR